MRNSIWCKGSWVFGNDFVRNIVIFGVDNSSSSNTNNQNNNFLVSSEGPKNVINDSTGAAGKNS